MTDAPPPDDKGGPSATGDGLDKVFSKLDLHGNTLPPSPAPSSPRNGRKYALATELVYTEGGDQYNASSTPIYQVRGPSFLDHDYDTDFGIVGHVQTDEW